jgi:hypothetical protein
LLADLTGGPDPLIGPGWRHPDVGKHHFGTMLIDRGQQFGKILTDRQKLEPAGLLEEELDALANDEAVLGQYQ